MKVSTLYSVIANNKLAFKRSQYASDLLYKNCSSPCSKAIGQAALSSREFPRHSATEIRAMSSANAVPPSVPDAAAQTSEKRFNQQRDLSSHTPNAVTASG